MTSLKKIESNRKNALKSTGPKTPEGKARSRLNAMKHGLLAERVITPEDVSNGNYEDFFALYYEMFSLYHPQSRLEEELVERIISIFWRLKRILKIEQQILFQGIFSAKHADTKLGEAFLSDSDGSNGILKLSRYEVSLERSLYRTIAELERIQRSPKSISG